MFLTACCEQLSDVFAKSQEDYFVFQPQIRDHAMQFGLERTIARKEHSEGSRELISQLRQRRHQILESLLRSKPTDRKDR